MLVDLHTHTYHSDGTMTVKELVKKAKERNIGVLAITDHNKIDSWEEFKVEAKKESIIPIKGVEINVMFEDKVLHLLAYNFSNTDKLLTYINKAHVEMERMSDDLIVNLSKYIDKVNIDDFNSYEYDRTKGGWKGLHYLFDRGVTNKLFDGFNYYRDYGCAYELYEFPNITDVCEEITKAGGYSVIAHPMEYYKNLSKEELLVKLEKLKESKIDGIECYYPTHSELMTTTCVEFCKANNLIITSGSDEHGEFGKEAKTLDQSIGCMKMHIDKLNIEKLIKENQQY